MSIELAAQDSVFSRTTLLVNDIKRSVDFYLRSGLMVDYEKSYSKKDKNGVFGSGDLPLTSDPKLGKLVIMKGKNSLSGTIGLLAYERPPLANARGNLMGVGVGDIIIVIETDNLNFVYNRLQESGARFHSPPKRIEESNSQDSAYHMFVYDPDGHLVEITTKIVLDSN